MFEASRGGPLFFAELWLQKNEVRAWKELQALKPLAQLQNLALRPNPLCTVLGSERYRVAVLAQVSWVVSLDGVTVREAERDSAAR